MTGEPTQKRANGSCLCGTVTFSMALPPKWVAHCHCSMCRRAHGAPYVTWVGASKDDFVVHTGTANLTTYKSSASATRQFCGRCGSPLFFRGDRWADEVHVARAAIPGDIEQAPTSHAYFSDKASWVHVDPNDGLKRKGGVNGNEPLEEPVRE